MPAGARANWKTNCSKALATLPATADYVFSTDDTLWETVFREIGHSLLKSMLHMKDLPPDPTVN